MGMEAQQWCLGERGASFEQRRLLRAVCLCDESSYDSSTSPGMTLFPSTSLVKLEGVMEAMTRGGEPAARERGFRLRAEEARAEEPVAWDSLSEEAAASSSSASSVGAAADAE